VSTGYGPQLATWDDVEAARGSSWEALTESGRARLRRPGPPAGTLATHDGYRLGLGRPADWEAGE
jgi:hypothetical protein